MSAVGRGVSGNMKRNTKNTKRTKVTVKRDAEGKGGKNAMREENARRAAGGSEERDVIVDTVARAMIPLAQLFAFYVMIGTEGAGGGFQGGVIFAATLILFGTVFGVKRGREALPEGPNAILSSFGLYIYAGVGLLCIILTLGIAEYLNYGGFPLPVDYALRRGYLVTYAIEVGIGITVAVVFASLFFDLAWREDVVNKSQSAHRDEDCGEVDCGVCCGVCEKAEEAVREFDASRLRRESLREA